MVALEALRGDKTAQEIAAKHKIHPTQVTTWKRQAIDGLTGVFPTKSGRLRITKPKSKNCTRRSASWRSKMIFCHKG
jgi:transposase-like protein